MKQTSIEWVLQYLNNVKPNEFCSIEKIKELLEQAKEMHKTEQEISDEEIFYQKQVMNPYPTGEQSYTAYEKGFMDFAKWYREQLKSKQ